MKTNLKSWIVALATAASVGAIIPATAARAGDVSVGVSVIARVPHGAIRIGVGSDRYYYHRGVFYRPRGHGYVVVHAPRGAFVREVPPHFTRIVIGGTIYYRDVDTYYRVVPGGYTVCDAPAVINAAPPPPPPAADAGTDNNGYLSVFAGKDEYFFKGGQFFRKTPSGYTWVEPVIGAVSNHLPGDAVSVWYQDHEYFESGGALFQNTKEGFQVVDVPWKKSP